MSQPRRASKSITLVLITSAAILVGCDDHRHDSADPDATQPSGSGFTSSSGSGMSHSSSHSTWGSGHSISSGSSHTESHSSVSSSHGTSHGGFGSSGHAASS